MNIVKAIFFWTQVLLVVMIVGFAVAQSAPQKPATPAALPSPVSIAQEEEAAITLRWQDVEKAQLALQNIVLQVQINHGWSKDYYYDYQARKFMHLQRDPAKEEKK